MAFVSNRIGFSLLNENELPFEEGRRMKNDFVMNQINIRNNDGF